MGEAGLEVVRVHLQPLILLTQLMERGKELLTITAGVQGRRRRGKERREEEEEEGEEE